MWHYRLFQRLKTVLSLGFSLFIGILLNLHSHLWCLGLFWEANQSAIRCYLYLVEQCFWFSFLFNLVWENLETFEKTKRTRVKSFQDKYVSNVLISESWVRPSSPSSELKHIRLEHDRSLTHRSVLWEHLYLLGTPYRQLFFLVTRPRKTGYSLLQFISCKFLTGFYARDTCEIQAQVWEWMTVVKQRRFFISVQKVNNRAWSLFLLFKPFRILLQTYRCPKEVSRIHWKVFQTWYSCYRIHVSFL